MSRRARTREDPFDIVRTLGLSLPDVEAAMRYDGAPVLRLGGCFMASLATHPSAEPDTLVVRMGFDEREWLLADAPETYYATDSYRRHPVVLVRLSRIERDALRDLLTVSWRLTLPKVRGKVRSRQQRSASKAVKHPSSRQPVLRGRHRGSVLP